MPKWTPGEDDKLLELMADGLSADEIGRVITERSVSAIYGRASTLGKTFCSREHQGLRDYLREGGLLVREEVGGAVGVRWAPATRCGGSFGARVCERLVALGLLIPTRDRANVFQVAT